MALTEKQRLFIAEYLIDWNATRAAIEAGYSEDSAYSTGWENLRKPEIAKEIERRLGRKLERLDIRADTVICEIARLAFANMRDYIRITEEGDAYVDMSQLSREQCAAIQEITVEEYTEGRGENKRDVRKTKFKLAEKRGALELLGKYLKLFTENAGDERKPLEFGNIPTASDTRTANKPN